MHACAAAPEDRGGCGGQMIWAGRHTETVWSSVLVMAGELTIMTFVMHFYVPSLLNP